MTSSPHTCLSLSILLRGLQPQSTARRHQAVPSCACVCAHILYLQPAHQLCSSLLQLSSCPGGHLHGQGLEHSACGCWLVISILPPAVFPKDPLCSSGIPHCLSVAYQGSDGLQGCWSTVLCPPCHSSAVPVQCRVPPGAHGVFWHPKSGCQTVPRWWCCKEELPKFETSSQSEG